MKKEAKAYFDVIVNPVKTKTCSLGNKRIINENCMKQEMSHSNYIMWQIIRKCWKTIEKLENTETYLLGNTSNVQKCEKW